MSITIRLASSNDIDAIFDIRTSVHENHLSIEQLAEQGITHQAIAEAIEAEPCLWIAECDGQALGFAMADRADACLFAVFVRPEYEGQGIGRALLEQAEAYLFASHAVIWLETDGKSRANHFYQARGWQQTKVLPNGDVRLEKRSAKLLKS